MPYAYVRTEYPSYVTLFPTLNKLAREVWEPINKARLRCVVGVERLDSHGRVSARARWIPREAENVLVMYEHWVLSREWPADIVCGADDWYERLDLIDRLYITPACEQSRVAGPEPAP